MKIFIDSADLEEIRQAYFWGIADGVTTNPSLMKKAVDKLNAAGTKVDLKEYINMILRETKGTPVSLEVSETTAKGIVEQGRRIYKIFNSISKNVVIKVPINPAMKDTDPTQFDSIAAIKTLSKEGIPVNCTLVFTPEQALLAAKAGARYVSPFAGRVDDLIRDKNKIKYNKADYFPMEGLQKGNALLNDNGIVSGIDLISKCSQIIKKYNLKTEVLAASIRNPRQVREAALAGSDAATLPFYVIKDMLKHQKTYEGVQSFTLDSVSEYIDIFKVK